MTTASSSEEYLDTKVENVPMEPALGADGKPITVRVDTRTGPLFAKVWLMHVGRVRSVSARLRRRRQQPGRSRADQPAVRRRRSHAHSPGAGAGRRRRESAAALGITPGVYHLNEGHSAFGPLEVIRERMHDDGMSFDDALREVAQHTVFTTHTPVPAGHDRFDGGLIEEHLGPLRDQLGISYEQLMGLGRVEPQNEGESVLHDGPGSEAFAPGQRREPACTATFRGGCGPICGRGEWKKKFRSATSPTACTFPVGSPSRCCSFTTAIFRPSWICRMGEPEVWQNIHNVDPGELWETHNALKNLLLAFVRRRVSRQCRRRGESDEAVEAARNMLDPNVLTIGFGRRFATYKRADLIMSDLDRLAGMCNDKERPVQFIFAGKAHPNDEPGKQLIQKIANLRHDPRFASRIVFVEDYDINVCRHMIQGVDVWLNNPRRPLEASGTSGQKTCSTAA